MTDSGAVAPLRLRPGTTLRRAWKSSALARGWVIGAVATILIASFVIFVALALVPGDPVARMLGGRATPHQMALVRHQLGLDQPMLVRYWHWLAGAFHGDFGTSIVYRTDVSTLLSGRIGPTLFLVAYAGLLVLVFGVGIGVLGGGIRRLGPWVAALVAFGIAIPSFVAAMLLVSVFALDLHWFPTIGLGTWFWDRLWHMTLPAIALAIAGTAYIAQITRATIVEERGREHVETAYGRGLKPGYVFRRHVLHNALVPIITVSALEVASLIANAVVVEYAFGIGGLGTLLVDAVNNKDYAVVEAITLILLVVFVVTTALLDAMQTALDPRRRDKSVRA